MKIRGVVVVFELASDVHIDKGVIEIPLAIAKYYNVKPYLITRPNPCQDRLRSKLNVIYVDNNIPENDQAILTDRTENLKFTKDWFIRATSKAADFGNFLFIYSFPENTFKSTFKFKLNNFIKYRRKSVVVVKFDKSTKVVNQKKVNVKNKLKFIQKFFWTDFITLENKETFDYYLKFYGFNKYKIKLLPNCPPKSLELINNRRNDKRENVIIHVGRIGTFIKATEVLLQAWIDASPQITGWRLKLAGSYTIEFYNTWNSLLKNKGIADSVIWMGFIKDKEVLFDEYLRSKIFIHTSREESGPIALFEAVRAGCGVIATNVGAAPFFLEDTELGMCNVDDIEGIRKAIVTMANDDILIERQVKSMIPKIDILNWDNQVANIFN